MPRSDGRVEPRQKIASAFSARAWNRAQDAADIVLGQQPQFGGEPGTAIPKASLLLLVRNSAGVVVPRLGVLGIGDPQTPVSGDNPSQFLEQMVLNGVMPTGGDQPVGVAVEPIEPGKIGRVAVSGRFPAKLKVLTTAHKYARGRAGDVTQLITAECGPFRVVWIQPSVSDGAFAAVIG